MALTWIGCAPANVAIGRAGFTPDAIVLHRADGTLGELQQRMRDPTLGTSAHYGVALDGRVEQYVSETDSAFHAGVPISATWPGIRANVNPNFHTIGIACEGRSGDAWPDALVEATADLVARVAARWSIAIDAGHVIAHTAIRAPLDCPGANSPFDDLIRRAHERAAILTTPTGIAQAVTARVTLNLRSGHPSRTSPIVGSMTAGSPIDIRGFTAAGESVDGNPFWYVDGSGRYFWAGATDVPLPWTMSDAGVSTDEMDLTVPSPPVTSAPPATTAREPAIDRSTLALEQKDYVNERVRKDLIVLHFTAGSSAAGAVGSWRGTPDRVATPYLIDRDGTIHETFPPDRWAFHLGIKGGTAHERRSIGIEIVNVGPLRVHPDDPSSLAFWPANFRQRYCRRDQTDLHVTASYRNEQFFATYTDAQMEAAGVLVRWLCETFSIPRTLAAADRRLELDAAAFASYAGVATHVNFRQDKWDVGPAFRWDRLGL